MQKFLNLNFKWSMVVGALGRTTEPAARPVEEAPRREPGEDVSFCQLAITYRQVLYESNTFLWRHSLC